MRRYPAGGQRKSGLASHGLDDLVANLHPRHKKIDICLTHGIDKISHRIRNQITKLLCYRCKSNCWGLQERSIERIGGRKAIEVDTRLRQARAAKRQVQGIARWLVAAGELSSEQADESLDRLVN